MSDKLDMNFHSKKWPSGVHVVSIYMRNMPSAVVLAQKEVFSTFGVPITQVKTHKRCSGAGHASAIDSYIKSNPTMSYFILFDIDAVPTSQLSVDILLGNSMMDDRLIGVRQQGIRLKHPYAGPVCMALSMKFYRENLSSIPFRRTYRSDVGEELTWMAEDKDLPVIMLWPSHTEEVKRTIDGVNFGSGTTYENIIYHAGQSRKPDNRERFIVKCSKIIEEMKSI